MAAKTDDLSKLLPTAQEMMEKLALAERLTAIALRLVLAISASDPDGVDTLRRESGCS